MIVPKAFRRRRRPRSGFTLLEILVVIAIVLLVSALALPTVVSALSHRQVGEGARLLQGALVGARDAAIRTNAPSGIRLLPDPAFPISRLADGSVDPNQILAANRIIAIEPAPAYSEGFVSKNTIGVTDSFVLPYPGDGGGNYPFYSPSNHPLAGTDVLMIEQCMYDPATGLPNPPTSWFWNIRVGDKIQITTPGPWFTVVGPMTQTPAAGNSEMFVNVGAPGTQSPLKRAYFPPNGSSMIVIYPEFLFLVNGRDDNANGWSDEGWDGVDNNGDGKTDELAEWEGEEWGQTLNLQLINNHPYTILRRPVPAPGARELALPTQVVIDLTTWGSSRERSRFPAQVINRYTGHVDVLVYPTGLVAPVSIYANATSFGLSASFLHFWLGERSDLAAASTAVAGPPYLPVPLGLAPARLNGLELKGEYRLLTVFTRTGQITSTANMPFDNPTLPASGTYNANLPFTAAQQGVRE